MRPHINAFFKTCAERIDCPEPIVELGSFQVPGQEAIADLRPFFPGRTYVGCDMRPGTGVDRIEDIHELRFSDGEVGTFLLADTLEHVREPFQAFRELHRCLRDDGVAIFSSVMHFPIHSYPDDYWRFTPQAFRELAREFPLVAILFAGDVAFPHTVCGVAAKDSKYAKAFREFAEAAAQIRTPAPPQWEGHARRVVQHLALKALGEQRPPATPGCPGGFDPPLDSPGWVLTTGAWVTGWASAEDVQAIELRSGPRVLLHAPLTGGRPQAQVDAKSGQPMPRSGFRSQIDLTDCGDISGRVELYVMKRTGERQFVCESAPGHLLGTLTPSLGFSLHSFDERLGDDRVVEARRLVHSIRARGERVVVDLGCGFRKQGTIGIDVRREGTHADIICRLGFEPIPLDDDTADEIVCRDFLEHIPKAVYSETQGKLIYPIIDLMNEIWRILKPGGAFISKTPCYPTDEVHQDPTHLSVWTLRSMAYFCGEYPIAALYGVKTRFELLENCRDGFYLHARLRKPLRAAA